MINGYSEIFESNTSYETILKNNTLEELKQMSKFFGLTIPQHLIKDEFVKQMAEKVLIDAPAWLERLPMYEMDILEKLLEKEPGVYVAMPKTLFSLCIFELNLVVVDEETLPDAFIYILCDDVRNAILPHIYEIHARRLEHIEDHVEKIILGLVNIYGRLGLSDLKNRVNFLLTDEKRAKINIPAYFEKSFLVDRYLIHTRGFEEFPDEEFYMITPVYPDPQWFVKNERRGLIRNAAYPLDTIIAFGEQPYVVPGDKDAIAFYDFLHDELHKSVDESHFTFAMCWYHLQMDVKVGTIISKLVEGAQIDDVRFLNTAVEKFAAFSNNCPRWMLKGNTPKGIGEHFGKEAQEQAARDPKSVIPFGDAHNPGLSPFIAAPKVGRNDACPCGSGKKYKHCCGQGN